MVSLRLRAGRRRKADRGGYAYGSPHYGTRAENKALVVDDQEQTTPSTASASCAAPVPACAASPRPSPTRATGPDRPNSDAPTPGTPHPCAESWRASKPPPALSHRAPRRRLHPHSPVTHSRGFPPTTPPVIDTARRLLGTADGGRPPARLQLGLGRRGYRPLRAWYYPELCEARGSLVEPVKEL
jgi:hypothetical protein